MDGSLCRMIQEGDHRERRDEPASAHVADCPHCRAHLEGVAVLGDRLRGLPASRAVMPSPLKLKLLASLEAEATPGGGAAPRGVVLPLLPRWRKLIYPTALAASLVLGFISGGRYVLGDFGGNTQVERTIGMYIEDVTHDHYLIERIGRPLEVAMSDEADLSRWLSESLSFPIELPQTGNEFALEGGRVWHTVGRLSAMASYLGEDGSRTILFGVPAANLELKGADSTVIGGRTVFQGEAWGREARVWIEGDLALALVSLDGRMPAGWSTEFLGRVNP
ncbi:MAG: hypothetical protein ABIK96_03700 [bacterium]